MSEYKKAVEFFQTQLNSVDILEGTEEYNEARLYGEFLKSLKKLEFNEKNASKSEMQLLGILRCKKQERCETDNYKMYREAVDEVLGGYIEKHIRTISEDAYLFLSILIKKDEKGEKYMFDMEKLSPGEIQEAEPNNVVKKIKEEYKKAIKGAKGEEASPSVFEKMFSGFRR